MANINAALPASIAIPFHPPTETLHHDNLIKPVIPKTEIIASYTKLREDEKGNPFSGQARSIIQDESEQGNDAEQGAEQQQQQSKAEQRRLTFFSRLSEQEESNESKTLEIIKDFKLALAVIEKRYNSSVTPFPDPEFDFLL